MVVNLINFHQSCLNATSIVSYISSFCGKKNPSGLIILFLLIWIIFLLIPLFYWNLYLFPQGLKAYIKFNNTNMTIQYTLKIINERFKTNPFISYFALLSSSDFFLWKYKCGHRNVLSKCGYQYFILLTLKKKKSWTQGPGFFF